MFVFIMYFCHIDRKKVFYHIAQVTLGQLFWFDSLESIHMRKRKENAMNL